QKALFAALGALARAHRLAMIELEHPRLSEQLLTASGFEQVPDWTYIVALTGDDSDAMWHGLDSTCRNRIRKALSAGLVVENTDAPAATGAYEGLYLDL